MSTSMEKRRANRFDSVQLISYQASDQSRYYITQGMGKTLNLSENGALIEVHTPIEKNHEVDIFFIVGKRPVEFKGRVMHHFPKQKGSRSSYCGINFCDEGNNTSLDIFKRYLSILNQNRSRHHPNHQILKPSINNRIIRSSKKGFSDINYVTGPSPDYVYIVEEEAYKAGTRVIREGNFGSWVYVILEGMVEVIKNTNQGPTSIQRLGPGSVIGGLESALIRDYERSTTIVATTQLYLGILDNHRLFNEYRNMSYPLQRTILSLCNRLKRVKRSAEEILRGGKKREIMTPFDLNFSDMGQLDNLYQIREGNVIVAQKSEKGYVPISRLYPGDVYGNLPIFNPEMNTDYAYISLSEDIKQAAFDSESIKKEYQALSLTYQNILSNYNMRISTLNNMIVDFYSKTV